ncbi:MAG TPA: hypothetical protein VJ856_02065, partial [Paludibacteraceae bacterium]|nr:hypothetical protein [Paludibacteraceae bacterium]
MLNYFPKYIANKAIVWYVIALVTVSVLFFSQILPFLWMVFGLVEVGGFFYFSSLLTRKWAHYSPKRFEKKIFSTALIIRIV